MRSVEARVEAYIIRTFDRLPYDQALAEYNALDGEKGCQPNGDPVGIRRNAGCLHGCRSKQSEVPVIRPIHTCRAMTTLQIA
jgi:hypothetical protein